MGQRLSAAFYERDDVRLIARELLGAVLYTRLPDPSGDGFSVLTGGRIAETEAYVGTTDRACHAYGGRRTRRTEIMYAPGGVAYVFLCYGIHALFNVVTSARDLPQAVLIRAIEPTQGMDLMLRRRGKQRASHRLTTGPGCVTQALGIEIGHTGTSLLGEEIWIEAAPEPPAASRIAATPRIGVDYAGLDALHPWRYLLADSPWVSHPPKVARA